MAPTPSITTSTPTKYNPRLEGAAASSPVKFPGNVKLGVGTSEVVKDELGACDKEDVEPEGTTPDVLLCVGGTEFDEVGVGGWTPVVDAAVDVAVIDDVPVGVAPPVAVVPPVVEATEVDAEVDTGPVDVNPLPPVVVVPGAGDGVDEPA